MARRSCTNPGTYELTRADEPGTMLLLASEGKAADRTLARRTHWRMRIDQGRRLALVPLIVLGADETSGRTRRASAKDTGLDPRDPKGGDDVAAFDASEAVAKILKSLAPEERQIAEGISQGKSLTVLAAEMNTPMTTLRRRWHAARARALRILGHKQ